MFRYDVQCEFLLLRGRGMAALYVVATPIGNLDDLSPRAINTLKQVEMILAEDTRRTGLLLKRLNIKKPLVSVHEYNEKPQTLGFIDRIKSGVNLALVSDAGTPLISDPGFHLVERCHAASIPVIPVAGPSAVTAALSAAGIPTDRFSFEGFVPSKPKGRLDFYQKLANESRTLVFFEAPHRIEVSLGALETAVGGARKLAICRELTKAFEQIVQGNVADVRQALNSGEIPPKGEFVLVLARAEKNFDSDIDRLLVALLPEMSPSKAAAVVARLTTVSKSDLYDRAMQLKS